MQRKIITAVLMLGLFFSLILHTVSAPSTSSSTVVRLDPANVVLGYINETFTLAAKIDNVEDLAGFGLQITWNTSYLEYVRHTITMPVEDYSGGLLHKPILITADMLNEAQGTYDCAAFTLGGGPFTGNGTAFEITLRVKAQPNVSEPDITFQIEFTLHALSSAFSSIPHSVQNCNVTINALWNPADVNDDLKVDIFDVMLGVNAYQATPSDPHWNPRCDIATPYDLINIFDIMTIVGSYGEEYPS